MDADAITPKIAVGACVRSGLDIAFLKRQLGVTAVLNVQTDDDFAAWDIDFPALEQEYLKQSVAIRRVPITDFAPEVLRRRLSEAVDALDHLLRNGHTVYVHCTAGVNRSPSVVISYLAWVEGIPLDKAVHLVQSKRSCQPYLDSIEGAARDRMREGRS